MQTDRRRVLGRAIHRGVHPVDRRCERGAVAVEFALILPLMLMLILGIIEFGFGYHAWDSTQNGVREGARLAAVDNSESNIEARVRGASSFLDPANLTVVIECQAIGTTIFTTCDAPSGWEVGDIVRVTANYSYDYITPLPGFVGLGANMAMTSRAEARYEGN